MPSGGGQPPPLRPPEPPAPREFSRIDLVAWRSTTLIAGLVAQSVLWTYIFLTIGMPGAFEDPRNRGIGDAITFDVPAVSLAILVWSSSMVPWTPRRVRVLLAGIGGALLIITAVLAIIWSRLRNIVVSWSYHEITPAPPV